MKPSFVKPSVAALVLLALAIAAPTARAADGPDEFHARLDAIAAPLVREMHARVLRREFDYASIDYDTIGAGLTALAAAHPEREDERLRQHAASFLKLADGHAPDRAAHWRAEFGRCPNPALQAIGRSRSVLEEAKTHPLELRFTAIDGREVDLERLRGKVVLLDFRGVTWCGACRDEEPFMKSAYATYRARGFEIVTITYEDKPESREKVAAYLRENRLAWPHSFDGAGSRSPLIRRFGITAVPRHYLLDQRGLLVSENVRGHRLAEALRDLLGPP